MRCAAFLRGINLGGRRVRGEQLCAPFETLGFEDVASFLASGNVTFCTDDAEDLESLEGRISEALRTALGYEVETFVRTAEAVAAVAGHEPFPAEAIAAREGKVQITFLHRAPDPEAIDEAQAQASEQDLVTVAGTEWYWLPAAGMSQSSLDVRAIERALGRGTTRTHNTVTRLAARLTSEPTG